MSNYTFPTLQEVLNRYQHLVRETSNPIQVVSELVDRAHQMGRWAGMVEETKLDLEASMIDTASGRLVALINPDLYSGAISFRTNLKGIPIMSILAMYQEPQAGHLAVVDLGMKEVINPEGVQEPYRCYMLPEGLTDKHEVYGLFKKVPKLISDPSDIVPISSWSAIKYGMLAIMNEDIANIEAAQIHWKSFNDAMELGTASYNGPVIAPVKVGSHRVSHRTTNFL